MSQRRWWVTAGIAVGVMVGAFPIEAIVAGLLSGQKVGSAFLGGLLGGLALSYASLPVIATTVVLGSLPFLRPRFGAIATGFYVALFGTVVAGVFAGTLYNGGRPWQAMFVGPGLWFWIIAAVAGFLTLWSRWDRAGAVSASVAAACILVLSLSMASIAHGTVPGRRRQRTDRNRPDAAEICPVPVGTQRWVSLQRGVGFHADGRCAGIRRMVADISDGKRSY